jgi:hypothetical protein
MSGSGEVRSVPRAWIAMRPAGAGTGPLRWEKMPLEKTGALEVVDADLRRHDGLGDLVPRRLGDRPAWNSQ